MPKSRLTPTGVTLFVFFAMKKRKNNPPHLSIQKLQKLYSARDRMLSEKLQKAVDQFSNIVSHYVKKMCCHFELKTIDTVPTTQF